MPVRGGCVDKKMICSPTGSPLRYAASGRNDTTRDNTTEIDLTPTRAQYQNMIRPYSRFIGFTSFSFPGGVVRWDPVSVLLFCPVN